MSTSSRAAMRLVGLVAIVAAVAASSPAVAQETPETPVPAWHECAQNVAFPGPSGEIYGPTDINAQSANGRMAVGVNRQGTVTVLRWPRPSFYDQVKYRTSSREAPRFGALPNEGILLGVAVTTAEGRRTVWLRDLPSRQRYRHHRGDDVETRYEAERLGLTIVVTDVVAADLDVLARHVTVRRHPGSPVTGAQLVVSENLNLVVSKLAYVPALDWCGEELNTDEARFDPRLDGIVHTRSGTDASTDLPRSVAIAVAFDTPSTQHQVGGDAHEGTASPDARLVGPTQDAYDDAADGVLQGGDRYLGQTTGAIATDLPLDRGPAEATVLVAGAPDAASVVTVVERARAAGFRRLVQDKRDWIAGLLRDAPVPSTDDPAIRALVDRALVSLVSVFDPVSGAVVASIATQSPYGEDWIRDGAFFNHVLDAIGRSDWVDQRVRWYAAIQSGGPGAGPPAAVATQNALPPPGNWAMNYYADGVVGGPIPWEIDETGYGLWAFWDHVAATGDVDDLRAVYPAVRRAADFLTSCVDPASSLQCTAIEDDNPQPRQTIHGAGPVWLGLDSAVRAARLLGESGDADRWAARRDTLGAAIDTHLRRDGVYGRGNAEIVWPVCLRPLDDFDERHYEAMWDRIAPSFDEPAADVRTRGLYESKALIALAKAKRDDPRWRARIERGLRWVATEHATDDTHVLGEEWLVEDGEVVSTVSQPHIWEQVLFAIAVLELHPPAGVEPEAGCGGVMGALRTAGDPADDDPVAPAAVAGPPAANVLPATGVPSALVPVALTMAAAGSLASARRRGTRGRRVGSGR